MSAQTLTKSALLRDTMPIVGGICVAVLTAILLRQPLLWTLLLLAAGLVLIPLLIVPDRLVYWLCLFLIALPFDVSKTFMDADRALALVEQVGATSGPFALELHLTDLALLPLLVVWLFRKVHKREGLAFPPISYVPLTFLCFTSLTALIAPIPQFALLAVMRQWKYFVVYVFATDALDVRTYGRTILAVLVATLLLQGTLTVTRYESQYFEPFFGETFGRLTATYRGEAEGTRRVAPDEADSPERGFGTIFHANATAMHLELLLPFALALALGPISRRWRYVYGCVFAVGLAGLYVTFSRAGLVAFLVSAIVCMFAASWAGLIPRRVWAPLATAGVLAGACFVPLFAAYMQTRPSEFEFHLEHLRQGMAIALRHPIFGVGLNNASVVRPFVVGRELTYEESQLPIHSGQLLGLAETGVIGFGLYVSFFVWVSIAALRSSKSADVYAQTFSIGVLGALTAMWVHSMTDYMGFDAFNELMWLYAGLIVAQRRWHPDTAMAPRHTAFQVGRALNRSQVCDPKAAQP